jgi:hypothetical protein
MNNNIAIQVVNLTKYYGELPAVDHVSFAVRRGVLWLSGSQWRWQDEYPQDVNWRDKDG